MSFRFAYITNSIPEHTLTHDCIGPSIFPPMFSSLSAAIIPRGTRRRSSDDYSPLYGQISESDVWAPVLIVLICGPRQSALQLLCSVPISLNTRKRATAYVCMRTYLLYLARLREERRRKRSETLDSLSLSAVTILVKHSFTAGVKVIYERGASYIYCY